MSLGIRLAERGWLPDALVRRGIRRLLRRRLDEQYTGSATDQEAQQNRLLEQLQESPLAVDVEKANEQHYEVPAGFYLHALGPHLKYSSAYWKEGVTSLGDAEADMLALTCERAELEDGQDILELGCGWGSLTLWMASHYPGSRVTAVSNSHSQREYIEDQCRQRGLTNVQVKTCDVNQLEVDAEYDRVVSVEMFEHLRNPAALLDRIASWLRPDGKLFIHIFCHKERTYLFETEADDDWMGRYFFTGGMMPSSSLLVDLPHSLTLDEQWKVSGRHYSLTAEAWLQNLDQQQEPVLDLFRQTYGVDDASRWFQRWRIFFLSCAELFGFREGDEWWVGHYRFRR